MSVFLSLGLGKLGLCLVGPRRGLVRDDVKCKFWGLFNRCGPKIGADIGLGHRPLFWFSTCVEK